MATRANTAAKRTTAPTAADLDRTFGELARVVARYRDDLEAFRAGDHGRIPAGMREHLLNMIETNEADLGNLARCHAAG